MHVQKCAILPQHLFDHCDVCQRSSGLPLYVLAGITPLTVMYAYVLGACRAVCLLAPPHSL